MDGPADEGEDAVGESEGGGKTNTPCRPLLILPPFPGKGRFIVGVGPQSTGGSIRAGRNVSNETK